MYDFLCDLVSCKRETFLNIKSRESTRSCTLIHLCSRICTRIDFKLVLNAFLFSLKTSNFFISRWELLFLFLLVCKYFLFSFATGHADHVPLSKGPQSVRCSCVILDWSSVHRDLFNVHRFERVIAQDRSEMTNREALHFLITPLSKFHTPLQKRDSS